MSDHLAIRLMSARIGLLFILFFSACSSSSSSGDVEGTTAETTATPTPTPAPAVPANVVSLQTTISVSAIATSVRSLISGLPKNATITVSATNSDGTPASSVELALAANSADVTIEPATVTTDSQGLATATVSATKGGSYTITVSKDGASASEIALTAKQDIILGQLSDQSVNLNSGAVSDSSTNRPGTPIVVGSKIFLPDSTNNRVLVFSAPLTAESKAELVIGQKNMSSAASNEGSITPSQYSLNNPTSVASDGVRLAIVDSGNHRVLVYNSIPTSNRPAADIVLGQADFTSKSANRGSTVAANSLSGPNEALFADGNLLVTDTTNNRVVLYAVSSLTTGADIAAVNVMGQRSLSTSTANDLALGAQSLSGPKGLDYYVSGPTKYLFVADTGNHRILIYDVVPDLVTYPVGTRISAAGYIGQANITTATANRGGAAASNTLSSPSRVKVANSKVAVVDGSNQRVLLYNLAANAAGFDSNTVATLILGQTAYNTITANKGNVTPLPGSYYSSAAAPGGAIANGSGLILSDPLNNRILGWNSMPSTLGQDADFVWGQSSMTTGFANRGGATASSLGTVFAASAAGTYGVGSATFYRSQLFVADPGNNRVLIFPVSALTSDGPAATIVVGQPDLTSQQPNQGGSPSAQTLKIPGAIAFDGDRMFILDRGNNRILIYDQIPTSNNAAATGVIGQSSFTAGSANRGGAADCNTLSISYYETAGLQIFGTKLLVTDELNNRVLIFDPVPTSGSDASARVVIGQSSCSAIGNAATQTTLYKPANLLVTPEGRLFIADTWNNRVLIYSSIPATPTGVGTVTYDVAADAVLGQSNFTSKYCNRGAASDDYTHPTASSLCYPAGLGYAEGKLYIGDGNNYRWIGFNSVPTAAEALAGPVAASFVIGQPDMTSTPSIRNHASGIPYGFGRGYGTMAYDDDRIYLPDTYDNYRIIGLLKP